MELVLQAHFHDPASPSPYEHVAADSFYAELLAAHEGLDAPLVRAALARATGH